MRSTSLHRVLRSLQSTARIAETSRPNINTIMRNNIISNINNININNNIAGRRLVGSSSSRHRRSPRDSKPTTRRSAIANPKQKQKQKQTHRQTQSKLLPNRRTKPPRQRNPATRTSNAPTGSGSGSGSGYTRGNTLSASSSSSSSSSVASSIVDRWEDDRPTFQSNRSRSAALYEMEAASATANATATATATANEPATATARGRPTTSVAIDRFRDRQEEYCRALDDYRSFWYPHDNAKSKIKSNRNDSDSDSDSYNPKHEHGAASDSGEQMHMHMHMRNMLEYSSFRHPEPGDNLPWISYETILASETAFRRVCASHHHLFLACASCLTDHTESQKQHHHQHHHHHHHHPASRQYHPQNRGGGRGRGSGGGIGGEEEDDDDDSESTNGEFWSDEDRFRAECEELLTALLPRWETLRRERAALVHRYGPRDDHQGEHYNGGDNHGDNHGDSDEPSGQGRGGSPPSRHEEEQQQQLVSPWATTTDHPLSRTDSLATMPSSTVDHRWVGWLKKIITGDESATDSESASDSLRHDFLATAHLDPECAPNHYHYTKLIGQLYFHYLSHERHIRKNPFHSYTKEERDRDLAAARSGSSRARHRHDHNGSENDNENDNHNHNHNDNDTDSKNRENRKGEDTPEGGLDTSSRDAPPERGRRLSYPESLAAYEEKRHEILRDRAFAIQSVVDHALAPMAPPPPSSSSAVSSDAVGVATTITNTNTNTYATTISTTTTTQLQEDDSNRVLTDKIVRLLIRSYLDQETLAAAQQAERVYHRHPNHRKHLLWYVAMSYLKVVKSLLKQQQQPQQLLQVQSQGSNDNGNGNANEARTAQLDEAALASKRICELVSSKYAKETREFQHCSAIAFEALAVLPEASRRKWKGYHDRVHSLGILKFGPKVWEALIHGNPASSSSSVAEPTTLPRHSSSTSSSSTTSSQPPPVVVDLSQSLNSNDHKILHHLIQIYSNDDQYFARSLRLLDVLLELYPAYDLQDSLKRSTFHKLLRKLTAQREKAWDPIGGSHKSTSTGSTESADGQSRELETALGILDRMVSHEWWFPNEDTFRILFPLASYSPNPAPGTERLMAKLEACRFLSYLSAPGRNRPLAASGSGSASASASVISSASSASLFRPLPPHPYCPLEASSHALTAWMNTASYHQYTVPQGHPHPAERAWAILQGLRVGSSPPLLIGNVDADADVDGDAEYRGSDHTHLGGRIPGGCGGPTDALYTLALKVCSRVLDSPRSLEVALDIFGAVQEEDLLLQGEVCRVLLGVVMNFSKSDSDNRRRIEATREVYEALVEADPDFGTSKPSVLGFLRKQASYIKIRHPDLYHDHLADLGLLGDDNDNEADEAE